VRVGGAADFIARTLWSLGRTLLLDLSDLFACTTVGSGRMGAWTRVFPKEVRDS